MYTVTIDRAEWLVPSSCDTGKPMLALKNPLINLP